MTRQSSSSSPNLRAYDAVDASTASAWRNSASLLVYVVRVSQACARVGSGTQLA